MVQQLPPRLTVGGPTEAGPREVVAIAAGDDVAGEAVGFEIPEQFDHGLEDGLRIGPVPYKGLLSP